MPAKACFLALFVTSALTEALAQSSTSTISAETTATLFLPPEATGDGFIATVINADACATTYGLACTSGSFGGTAAFCEPSLTGHVTYFGSTSFYVSTQTVVGGGTETFIEGCKIHGTTSAVCSRTYGVTAKHAKSKVITSTTTLTSPQSFFAQIPITAGANKLKGLSAATCTPSSTSSSAGAAATEITQSYRVLVAQAAVAVVWGAIA